MTEPVLDDQDEGPKVATADDDDDFLWRSGIINPFIHTESTGTRPFYNLYHVPLSLPGGVRIPGRPTVIPA